MIDWYIVFEYYCYYYLNFCGDGNKNRRRESKIKHSIVGSIFTIFPCFDRQFLDSWEGERGLGKEKRGCLEKKEEE